MIAGPKITRTLSSFDETLNDYGESTESYSQHENTSSFESMFKKDLSLKKLGNPFFEDTEI